MYRFSGLMTVGNANYTCTPDNFQVREACHIASSFSVSSLLAYAFALFPAFRPSADIRALQPNICGLLQCLMECREDISEELKLDKNKIELSMGMSGDFELAVSLDSQPCMQNTYF